MKIISTSDWHLGNMFHGNDRLPEHKHFLGWLIRQLRERQPDALLVAGDIFDNGNPSAASQSVYYEFLADATEACPDMQVIIIAGNHDSANRLEAPRALLARHKVEIRGTVRRRWEKTEDGGVWVFDYDDLMIPVTGKDGEEAVVLAVPYLRGDILQGSDYSVGVNDFLHRLTDRAREVFPGKRLVMMAHMYASGAEIAKSEASEKIVIGGQEEVNMEGWTGHPDYLTCGHIHKRQHIWNTDWARYTGSVLPMSFAECGYTHGVDLVTFAEGKRKPEVTLLEYVPQHRLRVLPDDVEGASPKDLKKLIARELSDRTGDSLDDGFAYLALKVRMDKVNIDDIKELEAQVDKKNAVLCKIEKCVPEIGITTIAGRKEVQSIDDIASRDPLEALKEAFVVKNGTEMSERQEQMLKELLESIKTGI